MPCGGFFPAQAGQSFRIRVTSPGNERLRAVLTDLNRATGQSDMSQFTGAILRGAGVPVTAVAGHSYHLILIKEPATGAISIDFTAPNGNSHPCNASAAIYGPWIVRAA